MTVSGLSWECNQWRGEYIIRASYRLFDGLNGYDNYVERRVSPYELERFGESVVDYCVAEMTCLIKDALFSAICRDREMLSLGYGREAAARAQRSERRGRQTRDPKSCSLRQHNTSI